MAMSCFPLDAQEKNKETAYIEMGFTLMFAFASLLYKNPRGG
jgi:hypothetical protein